ncbi:monovalent cation/H(+) antiporter subunit G [Lentibacillus sediminis]|uniref:monovalent cation/H(+) antiporter subunit G n=1 Tax=Lentibacillus sediminis TaxID=1940529 RepID=UPI000C1C2631|nr:monovalent cation/H(+) antiporter subunit G [Lentibacillus sediminis]
MTEIVSIIANILVILFLLAGAFFIVSAAVGVVRFPDLYTRLHASSKASTLGVSCILVAGFIYLYSAHAIVSGKMLLAILFIMLTNPVSAHMLGRAAHASGIKPFTKNRSDAYADAMKNQRMKSE